MRGGTNTGNSEINEDHSMNCHFPCRLITIYVHISSYRVFLAINENFVIQRIFSSYWGNFSFRLILMYTL